MAGSAGLKQARRASWWGGGGKLNGFRTDVRKGAETMATGTIKRLVRERGFGFIQGHDGVELFFHRSALQGEGFDMLAEGQAVEFDVERGDKGPRAANMKVSPPNA
jgi:CspA family cold shock protein